MATEDHIADHDTNTAESTEATPEVTTEEVAEPEVTGLDMDVLTDQLTGIISAEVEKAVTPIKNQLRTVRSVAFQNKNTPAPVAETSTTEAETTQEGAIQAAPTPAYQAPEVSPDVMTPEIRADYFSLAMSKQYGVDMDPDVAERVLSFAYEGKDVRDAYFLVTGERLQDPGDETTDETPARKSVPVPKTEEETNVEALNPFAAV